MLEGVDMKRFESVDPIGPFAIEFLFFIPSYDSRPRLPANRVA